MNTWLEMFTMYEIRQNLLKSSDSQLHVKTRESEDLGSEICVGDNVATDDCQKRTNSQKGLSSPAPAPDPNAKALRHLIQPILPICGQQSSTSFVSVSLSFFFFIFSFLCCYLDSPRVTSDMAGQLFDRELRICG